MKLIDRRELDYLVRRMRRRLLDAQVAGTEKARRRLARYMEREPSIEAVKTTGERVHIRPRLEGWDLKLHVEAA